MFPIREYRTEKWHRFDENPDYQVSSMGRIRGMRGRVLKPAPNKDGYLTFCLCGNGRKKSKKIHRLVAEAFIGKKPDGYETCHINGNPADNRVVNLKYVTPTENQSHRIEHGTSNRGERCGRAKLTWDDVIYIRRHYKPRSKVLGARVFAKTFGVTEGHILNIIRGDSWRPQCP